MKKDKGLNFFERIALNLFLKSLKGKKMNDIINKILAQILNVFKTKTPGAYGVVVLIVTGLFLLLSDAQFLALLPPDIIWLPMVIKWVGIIYGALSSAPTLSFLPKEQQLKMVDKMQDDHKDELLSTLTIDKRK